jgi:hypothetical protein
MYKFINECNLNVTLPKQSISDAGKHKYGSIDSLKYKKNSLTLRLLYKPFITVNVTTRPQNNIFIRRAMNCFSKQHDVKTNGQEMSVKF